MEYGKMMDAVVKALRGVVPEDKQIDTCVDSEMALALDLWASMYEDRAVWLSKKAGIKSAGIASAVSAELARLATLEMQSEVDDPQIDEVYQRMIREIRVPVEYGCALGGVLFKPYVVRGADGRESVATQYIRADRFFPLAFDSSRRISECVLIEQAFIGRNVYTRMEFYSVPLGRVYNFAFRATREQAAVSLGVACALGEVPHWALFAEEAPLTAGKLPFGYFRVPLASTVSADSPLGVSVFSRAVGPICEADRRYSYICWEYEAKEAAIFLASSMLKMNPATGNPETPGGPARQYRLLQYNMGAVDKPFMEPYSPEIRADAFFAGYQNQLKIIEFNCGLAYGTISDPQATEKTATEIRSGKQRLYATVTDIQAALGEALRDYVDAVAVLLGKRPEAVNVSFTWDDSVVVDSESLRLAKLAEYNAGIIDAVQYFIDVYGMTEETAIQRAGEIAQRKADALPDEPAYLGGGVE